MSRAIAVLAFVALWMAAGFALRLDANAYLLLGVPLTILFQRFVRRQPVRALWVRAAPAWKLTPAFAAATLALAAAPLYGLASTGVAAGPVVTLWYVGAIAGAAPAAYALQHLRANARGGFVPATIVVALVTGAMLAVALHRSGGQALQPRALATVVGWSLLYFPVCFVIEEVTFRGALDSHAQSARHGLLSAAFVAVLWGLWHLPVVSLQQGLAATAIALALTHGVIGATLAYSWRRSGNLAIRAAAHALIDGVRNGLGFMSG